MESTKRVICIDLDGTLVDSSDSILRAIEKVMLSLSIPIPKEKYDKREVKQMLMIARKHLPANIPLSEFKQRYDAVLSNAPLKGVRVNSGMLGLTESLRAQGFTLCVLTNKRQSIAASICNALFPQGTFDAIIGRKSLMPIKPYLTAIDELKANNIRPSLIQCLIGDSDDDRLMAQLLSVEFYNVNETPPERIIELIQKARTSLRQP